MSEAGKILVAESGDDCFIKLIGDVRVTLCITIDEYINSIFHEGRQYKSVVLDFLELEAIDSTTLGLMAKLAIHAASQFDIRPTIFCVNESILKLLKSTGFEQLFDIQCLDKIEGSALDFRDLRAIQGEDEDRIRDKVLEAHRILMTMNKKNAAEFRELVENLEKNR